jgi:hypothetical protein
MDVINLAYVLGISFVCRVIAHMMNYSMQYGQLFDFVKLRAIKLLDEDIYDELFGSVGTITEGEENMTIAMDIMCKRHKILGLIDCVYCMGFWLSVLCMVELYSFIGIEVLLLPIFTYFLIEKL